ncbi:Cyp-29A4 [Aphelenchoides besseyi]|nr:Cyp-29A4 [Aphelenchoides besseyi]
MKLWIGSVLRLYVIGPDTVRMITSSSTEIKKAFDYDRLKLWLCNGLVTSHGDQWKKSRKLLTPTFHFTKLADYINIMDVHVRELIAHLDSKTDGEMHDIYKSIKLRVLDVICETAMGIELNALHNPNQPYIKAVKTFLNLTFLQGTNSLYLNRWYWKWLGYEKQKVDALKELKRMSSEVIRRRIEIRKTEGNGVKSRPDFLDVLLNRHQNGEMDFEEIREQMDTFLFAEFANDRSLGYDTTSNAISYCLWYLTNHPEIQEKVYEEIENAFQSDTEFASNKLKELPYLEAVIKEALRMFPPVAGIMRDLENEIQIGEQKLPAGSTVHVTMFLLHHNEKIFSDSWKFDPSRFLSGQTYPPTAYIPFSAGVRNCIGQRFANMEMRIFLCHLIHNFRFSSDVEFLDNRPRIEIALVPTKAFRCEDLSPECGAQKKKCDDENHGWLVRLKCPKSCSTCQSIGQEECQDRQSDCADRFYQCHQKKRKSWMRKFCEKTCGFCRTEKRRCEDTIENCKELVANGGLCTTKALNRKQIEAICGESCGFCLSDRSV